MKHTYAVIMAGGGGTRLWPISRKKHPKHVLPLLGERTLFQSTLDRLEGFVPPERVYIVTTAEQEQELKAQAPQLPAVNFLIEPMPRGTASVVGLAAAVLAKRDPEAVMLVLPADHFIRNRDLFHLVMRVAVQVARKDYLVTLGITPTFPATGYGYIQRDAILPEKFDYPVYRVLHFTEKPDEAKANIMLADGDHSWNSGMFIWRADRILDEFSRQMPDLKAALARIGAAWGTSESEAVLRSAWPRLKPETIDYGIMEHAANVAVLPAGGLEWSDVGSWDSLFDVLLPDEGGNVVVNSEHMPLETHNSLVYSSGKKLIVTIGVDDLIVIDSGDALLVCHRDQAQQVRQVIANLKKSQREDYL
ncbi:MAG: mannose-1-phosphate guanylyltransferase [Chloroflexi bacterium]|nr:mannose-1-phosphate guanylyltransferase [Chloroflexota bacterium]